TLGGQIPASIVSSSRTDNLNAESATAPCGQPLCGIFPINPKDLFKKITYTFNDYLEYEKYNIIYNMVFL
ncbi:hypothetical protein KEM09_21690, partial [Carboxylicivirga mesophila]